MKSTTDVLKAIQEDIVLTLIKERKDKRKQLISDIGLLLKVGEFTQAQAAYLITIRKNVASGVDFSWGWVGRKFYKRMEQFK